MVNHPNRRAAKKFTIEASGYADTKRVVNSDRVIVAMIQQLSNGLWIVEDAAGRRNENFELRLSAKAALGSIEKYPDFLMEKVT
jgi:hypothetical protein